MKRTAMLLPGLFLILSACSPIEEHCVPGMSSACVCPSGDPGAQVCKGDSTYGPCTCAPSRRDLGMPDGGRPSDPDQMKVPCSSDLQCTALPGYGCNDGYQPPVCELLNSKAEGSPCDTTRANEIGSSGARFCKDGLCRHTGAALWTCQVAPISYQECLDGCRATGALNDCPNANCMAKCTKAQTACATRGGLSSVFPHCGDGGWAFCGADQVVDF